MSISTILSCNPDIPSECGYDLRMVNMSPTKIILIVEDDLDIAAAAEECLQHEGHEVHVALSAADGLNLLNRGLRPDLIFTDVFMPGPMTGVAFVREALKRLPEVKVLMTSGFSAPIHFVKKPADIEHDFLAKPYGLQGLVQRVRGLLSAVA